MNLLAADYSSRTKLRTLGDARHYYGQSVALDNTDDAMHSVNRRRLAERMSA